MKKLERERHQLLADVRAMYRRHVRAAVDADDVKQVVELIKYAQVAKDWLWIYEENGNPWANEAAGNDKTINVRIFGENDLI